MYIANKSVKRERLSKKEIQKDINKLKIAIDKDNKGRKEEVKGQNREKGAKNEK
jgi:hypothetical protein